MAKKKLLPEYQFTIGKESDMQKTAISNLFAGIKESERRFFTAMSGMKNSVSNNASLSLNDVARNFIRKNADDNVFGELSMAKGIKSDNYLSGALGTGYKLYKDEYGKGNLEIDRVTVREQLFTKLLTYEKLNAIGGTLILSAAWCEVTNVEYVTDGIERTNDRVRCYYIPNGVAAQLWMISDQVRLQSGLDRFLLTYVTDVSTEPNSDGEYMVELYFGDEEPDYQQGNTTPSVGDTLVQWGHRGGANPERKNIVIISSGDSGNTYPYIEQYENVNSFDIANKLVSRISKDVYFGAADKSKYLWWNKDDNGEFLLKGTLTQSPSDDTFPTPVYRGVWLGNTEYYKGDVVTHNGTTYIAVSPLSLYDVEPPAEGEWEVYAAAGTDGEDGADGVNGKMLSITGSAQVFKIDKFVVGTPEYITVTAVGSNLSGTPTFSVSDGTATLTGETSFSQRLYLNNMTTDKATIKVVWDGFTDYFTIYKVREGSDAVTVVMSNESATIPATSAGVATSFANTGTNISVFYGATVLEFVDVVGYPSANWQWSINVSPNSDVDYDWYDYDDDNVYSQPIVGLGSTSVIDTFIEFDIRVRVNNTNRSIVKRQTFSVVRNGAKGDTGDVGQAIRYTKWISGNIYFAGNINDGGSNNNPNRYLDYVTNIGTDGIVRAYKCKVYHTASTLNEPKTGSATTEWDLISYIPALASDLVLARQAVIGGFVFSEAVDSSGNQIAPSAQYMRTTDSPTEPATILRGDGSGHFAKGNIEWDADGNGALAGGAVVFNLDGSGSLGNNGISWGTDKNVLFDMANFKLNSSGDVSLYGAIATAAGTGQRIVIDPADKSIKMYDSSNRLVMHSYFFTSGVSAAGTSYFTFAGSETVPRTKMQIAPTVVSLARNTDYGSGGISWENMYMVNIPATGEDSLFISYKSLPTSSTGLAVGSLWRDGTYIRIAVV